MWCRTVSEVEKGLNDAHGQWEMRVILKQDGYDSTEITELERADVLAAE